VFGDQSSARLASWLMIQNNPLKYKHFVALIPDL